MTAPSPISVVLAEDIPLFREGLTHLLQKGGGIQVTGEAENGLAALQLLEIHRPDVVVTDIDMPEMDGIALTKAIQRLYPGLPVLALTVFGDERLVVEMLEAGAKGYLLKSNRMQVVSEAIRALHAGGWYYCESTSPKLLDLISQSKVSQLPPPPAGYFTDQELAIIQLICQEFSTEEISKKIFLGVRTIEGYRHKIFQKAGVKNMVGLAMYAVRTGMYRP